MFIPAKKGVTTTGLTGIMMSTVNFASATAVDHRSHDNIVSSFMGEEYLQMRNEKILRDACKAFASARKPSLSQRIGYKMRQLSSTE